MSAQKPKTNKSDALEKTPKPFQPTGVDWDSVPLIPSKKLRDAMKKDVKRMTITFEDGMIKTTLVLNDGREISPAEYRQVRKRNQEKNTLGTKLQAFEKRFATRPELKDLGKSPFTEVKNIDDLNGAVESLPEGAKKILLMDNKQYRSFRTNIKPATNGAGRNPPPENKEEDKPNTSA